MPESVPVGAAKRARVKFTYYVSPEFIARSIDEHGVEPANKWEVVFDLKDEVAEPSLRRRLRVAHAAYSVAPTRMILPEPVNDPKTLLRFLEPWLADQAGLDDENFEIDMVGWIAEHGSSRLSVASARGYKVTRLYARERVLHDVPGGWVDTSGAAKARARTDPSQAALDLETKFLAELSPDLAERCGIRWVTDPPPELSERFFFEPQEAVVILGFLGRYRVYVFVDSNLYYGGEEEEE